MPNKVSLIIIHWDSLDILKQQLKLLNSSNFQIILVNNNPNISLNSIKKRYPKIK